jgi:phage shock protein B
VSLTLFVLGLIALIVVAPIWIVAHYVTQWRAARSLSREDERALGEMWETAQKLQERIDTLERVLDAQAPGWRARETP